MKEQELINKIKQLKTIKPNKDWVCLTKSRILDLDSSKTVFQNNTLTQRICVVGQIILRPALTPVFAGILVIVLGFGVFVVSQRALPGDLFFSVKKTFEKTQSVFVSKQELPKYNLAIANKRLEELNNLITDEPNQSNLEPIIEEIQENVNKAAKTLALAEITTSSDPVIIKKFVEETKKLEENKEKAEALGVAVPENEELDNVLAILVEREINALEGGELTEEQVEALTDVKQDYETGKYSQALEKILFLSYPQDE